MQCFPNSMLSLTIQLKHCHIEYCWLCVWRTVQNAIVKHVDIKKNGESAVGEGDVNWIMYGVWFSGRKIELCTLHTHTHTSIYSQWKSSTFGECTGLCAPFFLMTKLYMESMCILVVVFILLDGGFSHRWVLKWFNVWLSLLPILLIN